MTEEELGGRRRKPLWAVIVVAVLAVGGLVWHFVVNPPVVEEVVDEPAAPSTGGGRAPKATGHGKRLPRPKACLSAATVEGFEGDEMGAMRVEQGLDAKQINAAFGPHLDFLNGCRPDDGEDHSGNVTFELHVGCDGLVKGTQVTDDSLYEPAMIQCLRDRLRYVDFPAHDNADGVYFEYPLIFH